MHTAIWVVDPDDPSELHYVADPDISWPEADEFADVRADDSFPVLEGGTVQRARSLELHGESVGWLVLQWADKRIFTADDDRTIDAIVTTIAWAVRAIRNS